MAHRVFPVSHPKGGGGSATIDTIAFYGAISGFSWLAYTLALQGSLGGEAKKIGEQIYRALHGGSMAGVVSAGGNVRQVAAPASPVAPVRTRSNGAGQSPIQPPRSGGGVSPGYYEDGFVFIGGDAGSSDSWVAWGSVPAGYPGYVELSAGVWFVLFGWDAGSEDSWAVVYNYSGA